MTESRNVARILLAELLTAYDNARRDEGAFPRGDRRAGLAEHRLRLKFNTARHWLKAAVDSGAGGEQVSKMEIEK